jgi:hypothetical protein
MIFFPIDMRNNKRHISHQMQAGTEPENIIEGGEIINTLLTKKF